jgi:hypothetical protein
VSSQSSRARWAFVKAAAAALALGAAPGAALAEPSAGDASPARTLFFEARKLMADGHWLEACPKLEESERLDPGKGTEFNLAECYEHVGRVASALALYERVAVASRADNMPAHEARARARAEALTPRVPSLVVLVTAGSRVDGLEVTRDGEPVPPEAWSARVHVEPGRHTVAARAPGRVQWAATVDLAEGTATTVEVPPLVVEPAPAQAAPVPTETPAPGPAAPTPSLAPTGEDPQAGAGRTQRTIALAVGGAGAASVVAGAIFGALSLAAHNQADTWCDRGTNVCTQQQGVDARNAAMDRGNAATWLLIAGGVAVSAGAVLWLSAPRARATPALGVSASGLVIRGEL